jgi:hypothetical protein
LTRVRTARGRRHCGGLFWNISTAVVVAVVAVADLPSQGCCTQLHVSCGIALQRLLFTSLRRLRMIALSVTLNQISRLASSR